MSNLELRELAARYLGMRGERVISEIHDYYNNFCFPLVKENRKYRLQPSDNWCAAFVSVMLHKLNMPIFTPEVSVFYMVENARRAGRWAFNNPALFKPKPNDLIVYNWKGRAGLYNHVGIIYHVFNDGALSVIEGNKSNEVAGRFIIDPHGRGSEVEGFINTGRKFR